MRTARAIVCLFCISLLACGTSETAPQTASISGTITYAGAAAGHGRPLAIAVYRAFPPKGPPVAWRLIEQYQLPYRYTFDNLPPGSYVVGALVDVDPADTRNIGQLNAARDPHGYSASGRLLPVDATHIAEGADIVLEDAK
ncbi:MAG: hypothetical protein HYV09_03000 [Deltaproteobacteria bacterium]|nr:hypothetical protein [Deltaproteobacteria bacterium]